MRLRNTLLTITLLSVTLLTTTLLTAPAALAADSAVDRWAKAVGGREKVAPIKAIYREATIQIGAFSGTIKAWHTADGRYRKEEQVGMYSTVETFDGTTGTVQQAGAPLRQMAGAELAKARSSAFANTNAIFFAFFPDRRHGNLTMDGDTIVMQREGGIDWRVTLDPDTSLPKVMTHMEGEKTITVTFVSYAVIDGITMESEIHRTNGDPRFGAVIRFTKTVINPPIDASLFTIAPPPATPTTTASGTTQ